MHARLRLRFGARVLRGGHHNIVDTNPRVGLLHLLTACPSSRSSSSPPLHQHITGRCSAACARHSSCCCVVVPHAMQYIVVCERTKRARAHVTHREYDARACSPHKLIHKFLYAGRQRRRRRRVCSANGTCVVLCRRARASACDVCSLITYGPVLWD